MVYLQKTYIERYFTIEVFEDGTVGIDIPNSANSIKYRVNSNKWVETSEAIQLSVSTNDKIQISCVCTKFENENDESLFNISTPFKVYGNVMSLLFGDDFEGKTDLTGHDHAFYSLFYDCRTLIYASNLILPATTLANYCYCCMFEECRSLTSAPELPATTLADRCYSDMFYNCISLTSAPELPATTLASYCYNSMFGNYISLTSAPELPATILADWCYYGMFSNCYHLRKAPELPATTLAEACYEYMFGCCTSLTEAPVLSVLTLVKRCYRSMFCDCTGLTSAPALPATTLTDYCYYEMFKGCTSLVSAPELPATTLAEHCYSNMFCSCTSLVSAPELPAETLMGSCYSNMFGGCNSLVSAPELPATTLASYCYYSMFRGCNKLNKITMLATDISAKYCLINWVNGIASNGTFVKHPNMNSLSTGTSGIPSGWTVEDYVLETNLITFYIGDKEYQAEEGMTWADYYISDMCNEIIDEWLNPPKDQIYNCLDYTIQGGAGWPLLYNNIEVKFGDYIQKEGNYQFDYYGAGY